MRFTELRPIGLEDKPAGRCPIEPALDIHQHLWPETFVAVLRKRREPPRLDGWTLHLAGERPSAVRAEDHDLAAREQRAGAAADGGGAGALLPARGRGPAAGRGRARARRLPRGGPGTGPGLGWWASLPRATAVGDAAHARATAVRAARDGRGRAAGPGHLAGQPARRPGAAAAASPRCRRPTGRCSCTPAGAGHRRRDGPARLVGAGRRLLRADGRCLVVLARGGSCEPAHAAHLLRGRCRAGSGPPGAAAGPGRAGGSRSTRAPSSTSPATARRPSTRCCGSSASTRSSRRATTRTPTAFTLPGDAAAEPRDPLAQPPPTDARRHAMTQLDHAPRTRRPSRSWRRDAPSTAPSWSTSRSASCRRPGALAAPRRVLRRPAGTSSRCTATPTSRCG